MAPKVAAGLKTVASQAAKSLKRTASKLSTKSTEAIKKRIRPRGSRASAIDTDIGLNTEATDEAASRSSISGSRSSFQATVEEIEDEDAPQRRSSSSSEVIDVDLIAEEELAKLTKELGEYSIAIHKSMR